MRISLNPRRAHLLKMDCVLFSGLLFLTLSDAFAQNPIQPLGKGDWSTPPYVTLSQRDAAYVNALPVLGTVEWTLEPLDFIEAGPTAGISGAAFVRRDGALYLAGGFIPEGDETDEPSRRTSRWVFRYDMEKRQWQKLPNMPGRKEYTRGIAHSSGTYIVGGLCQKFTAEGYSGASPDVFHLVESRSGPRWEIHSQLTVPRTHPSAGAIGSRLIVAGGNEYLVDKTKGIMGLDIRTMRDTVEVFDLEAPDLGWQSKQAIPGGPRGWAGSSAVGERFYLFGGIKLARRKDGKTVRMKLNDALSYDPQRDAWIQHESMPFFLSGWEGATLRNRYVILVGGVEAEKISAEKMAQHTWNDIVFAYDTEQDRWLRLEGLTPPGGVYNDPGVVVVGDTIYVVGGEGPRGSHFDHFLTGKINIAE